MKISRSFVKASNFILKTVTLAFKFFLLPCIFGSHLSNRGTPGPTLFGSLGRKKAKCSYTQAYNNIMFNNNEEIIKLMKESKCKILYLKQRVIASQIFSLYSSGLP